MTNPLTADIEGKGSFLSDTTKLDFIKLEQTRRLFRHSPLGFIATIFNASLLVALLWNLKERALLVTWLATLLAVIAARNVLQYRFSKQNPAGEDLMVWRRRFTWTMGITGAVWGSISLFLLPDTPIVYQFYVGFLIGGMVSGAVGIYSCYFPAFLVLVYPMTVPLIVVFFSYGDRLRTPMGIMSSLFLVIMTIVAKRHGEQLKEMLSLKFENTGLITELQTEIDVRKAAEERLLGIKEQIEEEVKHLQNDLQQAQKMEAIGRLAGGVAHDLNNILSGIVTYPDFLLEDIKEGDALYIPLRTIRDSGIKASNIVQDLLTLSRRGVASKDVINLNDLVNIYMLSNELDALKKRHPKVHVVPNLDPDLLNVLGSDIHLQKCLMNLVINAAEAMPAGGLVSIRTYNRHVDSVLPEETAVKKGDYAVLEIADNGIGMSVEVQEHIFEPFFSRKKLGRSGSGLGMAVVWGVIKDHDGHIEVSSREGEGTRFSLLFPVTSEALPLGPEPEIIDDLVSRGDETVLVVDDLPEQRDLAEKLLSKLGYTVSAASSGEEAVEWLKERSADLVVLDMILESGMDGLDTFRTILGFRPGQRTIIVSGYSENSRVKEAQALGAGAYLKKPYTLKKLGKAVRDALDRPRKKPTGQG